jgi:hypothetical protein
MMAKVLTDKEIGEIIHEAIHDKGIIDCSDSYTNFLEALADLVCDHFGGERGGVGYDSGDGLGWTVCFKVDEYVPDDGGVYAKYDTDVTWNNNKEVQE